MVDIPALAHASGKANGNGSADAADEGPKSSLPFEQMGLSFSHGAPLVASSIAGSAGICFERYKGRAACITRVVSFNLIAVVHTKHNRAQQLHLHPKRPFGFLECKHMREHSTQMSSASFPA